jgi:membrane protease YdiL (CAAX protease family)
VVKHSTSQRSPLSPTRWPPNAFTWWRSGIFLALVLLATAVGVALALLFARGPGAVGRAIPDKLTWGIAVGQLVSYVPIVAVIVSFLPWVAQRSLADLGWRRPDARTLGAALIGAVAMYAVTIVVAGLQFVITHAQPHEEAVTLFTSTRDPALMATFSLIAVVAAPIVEESVFRGFLFNALLRYAPVWLAATISGILFGLTHFSPSALAPLACSGIVLAYVYYASGSLVAAMITHAIFNALNLAAIASGHA